MVNSTTLLNGTLNPISQCHNCRSFFEGIRAVNPVINGVSYGTYCEDCWKAGLTILLKRGAKCVQDTAATV